jgi:hypothetical protein
MGMALTGMSLTGMARLSESPLGGAVWVAPARFACQNPMECCSCESAFVCIKRVQLPQSFHASTVRCQLAEHFGARSCQWVLSRLLKVVLGGCEPCSLPCFGSVRCQLAEHFGARSCQWVLSRLLKVVLGGCEPCSLPCLGPRSAACVDHIHRIPSNLHFCGRLITMGPVSEHMY